MNRLSGAVGIIILLLALGAIAQQGGAPSRGAGSGGSGAAAATTYGATYGYTWGSTRRCATGRNGNQPISLGLGWALNGCTFANTYPDGVQVGYGYGTMVPDASVLGYSLRAVCDGYIATGDNLTSIRGSDPEGLVWRGNDAGARLGGFHAWIRWFRTVGQNTDTVFAGLRNTAVYMDPANHEYPLALPDTVFMWCAEGAANYSICSNDATAILDGGVGYENAQCTTLGAAFPCSISSDGGYGYGATGAEGSYYDFILTADPSASIMTYYVKDIRTGAVAQGALTSKLPTETTFLNYQIATNNGFDAGLSTIGFTQICFTTK